MQLPKSDACFACPFPGANDSRPRPPRPGNPRGNAIVLWCCALMLSAGFGLASPSGATSTGPSADLPTLRLDYLSCGAAGVEKIVPVAYRREGPWTGVPQPGDATLELGEYRFEVVLWPSGRNWFSGGFSTLFSEWQTTEEARRGDWRCFEGSLRFPSPPQEFRVQVYKRSGSGPFQLLASLPSQKPDGVDVIRATAAGSPASDLLLTGPATERYDLLLVAEGYAADEAERFREDAQRFQHVLLHTAPFARLRDRLNIRALFLASPEAGVPDPRRGFWPRTSLGLHYNSLGLDRYVVVTEEHRLREAIAGVPYDLPIILLNSDKYGGGGVYRQWAVVAARAEFAEYIFLHELGHALAGLGDEYFTSEVPYLPDAEAPEPWQPNVTRIRELSRLKWRTFVTPGIPIPTPWGKDRYLALQARARREGWTRSQLTEKSRRLLRSEPYFGRIGLFEGGNYQAEGTFRPSLDCLMFDRSSRGFCRVCEDAVARVLQLYSALR